MSLFQCLAAERAVGCAGDNASTISAGVTACVQSSTTAVMTTKTIVDDHTGPLGLRNTCTCTNIDDTQESR